MARIEREEFRDLEEYPVEASRGGRNAFYKPCDVVGHSPAYCICVNKVHAYNRGDRNFWPECITAIDNNRCQAVGMLAEEQKAGKAIYFVNRTKLQEFTREQEELALGPKEEVVRKPVFESAHVKAMFDGPAPAKPKPLSSMSGHRVEDGYAKAINLAIAEASAPKPVAEDVPKVQPIAGESLLDMARRMMAAKSQPQE